MIQHKAYATWLGISDIQDDTQESSETTEEGTTKETTTKVTTTKETTTKENSTGTISAVRTAVMQRDRYNNIKTRNL